MSLHGNDILKENLISFMEKVREMKLTLENVLANDIAEIKQLCATVAENGENLLANSILEVLEVCKLNFLKR